MEYVNTQYLLNKRPKGMPSDECWRMHEEKITSLKKEDVKRILESVKLNQDIEENELLEKEYDFNRHKKIAQKLFNINSNFNTQVCKINITYGRVRRGCT